MRRLQSMVWMLGSATAALCGALTVTLADAVEPQTAAGLPRWSADEKAVLASLSLKRLPAAPMDPSNAVERQPAAAALGQRLFNDVGLSRNGAISCASCHDPARQFQDGRPVSQGVGTGSRRAMPIVGASHATWLFWNGRKDSLWAQALGPLEDAVEHGTNRTRVAHQVAANHRTAYEAVFGALPRLDGLPGDAGPMGSPSEQAAWLAIEAPRRSEVSRVFANVGKAIAAYEKTLQPTPTGLDNYIDAVLRGDRAAASLLRADEARGLRVFIGKGQCVSCHNGPLFTDQQFHNTGVPQRDAARPDRGRAAATAAVRGDEFNCLGPFSDARPEQCQELRFMVSDDPALEAAFKTPGLRGVADRAPYMHAGQFTTLQQVVRHYVAAPRAALGHSELTQRRAGTAAAGHAEREPIALSESEVNDLVSFLGTLSAERRSEAVAPTTLESQARQATTPAKSMGHIDLPQGDGGMTTVFYPTEAAESAVRKGPFRLSWADEAPPSRGNGRLVVISHGSGGSPWVHVDLARVLVEGGFTVALPQHAGDNYQDSSEPGPASWVRRPIEVSQAIDRVAADGRLAPHLNFDAVGVFGGSAGGHTALSLAGGAWSPSRFRDHCLQNIEQDFSSCVGFITLRRGDGLDGLKTWAARLVIRLRFSNDVLQRHSDPRIAAVVAMVPFAADFDPGSLRQPAVPLGLVIADLDVNQVPQFHVEAVRQACAPRCEVLARLAEGGHGAMLSPLPPLEPGSVAQRLLEDPASFDRAVALPRLHADIARFFSVRLGTAR